MTSHPKEQLVQMFVAFVIGCAAGVSELRADPLKLQSAHFLVDPSPTRLDLFSNPGVVLEPKTFGTYDFPGVLIFGTSVAHAGGVSFTDTIRFTYQEQGAAPLFFSQTFTTGSDPIVLAFAVGFEPISRTGSPVATTLTVELLYSNPDFVIPAGPDAGQLVDAYTYSFYTMTPVPEPSTLLLLSSGVAALAVRRRHRPQPHEPKQPGRR